MVLRTCSDFWPGPIALDYVVGTWCGYYGWQFIPCICAILRWRWRPIMRLAKDLLGDTSDLLQLLTRTNNFNYVVGKLCGYHCWQFTATIFRIMHWRLRPIIHLAKNLSEGTSDLLRLLAWTNHLKLSRWDFVWVPWLTIHCADFHYHASEMAPDHASGERRARGYLGSCVRRGTRWHIIII